MAARRVFLLIAFLFASGCDNAEPVPEEEVEPVRILSYNIWHDASGWPERFRVIVDTLRTIQPDVICLQEVLQHETLPNQAHALADSLGYSSFFTSVDTVDRVRRYGNAILTRAAIQDSAWKALEPASDYRNVGYVRTSAGDREIDVFCTHLHHTEGDSGAAIRQTQIVDLVGFIDSTRTADAAVVAGDFNAEPGGDEFAPLTQSFDDAYVLAHGDGPRPTTLNPFIGHRERWIDYVFVEQDAGLNVLDVRRILTTREDDALWASDHFGVLAELSFDGGR